MKKRILLLLFLILMLLFIVYIRYQQFVEYFEVYPSTEERVINLYQEVLQREPTSTELINDVRDIKANVVTWNGLRQKLVDRDEYSLNIKMQSNTLTPELNKMISDSRIIREMSDIYKDVRKKPISPRAILPLRDIYVNLSYNPYALRAVLRDDKYQNFEDDLLRIIDLNKPKTLELFADTFDQVKIMQEASQQAKDEAAKKITESQQLPTNAFGQLLNAEDLQKLKDFLLKNPDLGTISLPTGPVVCAPNAAPVSPEEPEAKEPTHEDDMVLRPEFAWSVPQKRPPVCTTPGQPAVVQPLLLNSKLLLGTPIQDASQTQIGSIMPKFEFKETP